MKRDDLVMITGFMHQIKKLIEFGTHISIGSLGEFDIQINFEEKFIEAAKALEQEIKTEERNSESFPYVWVFTYNGVRFSYLANERYTDAETTTREERMQSGDA